MGSRKEALASALGGAALILAGAAGASAQTTDDEVTALNGSEQTLPFTGADPAWVAGAGLLLLGAGVAMRRVSAARATRARLAAIPDEVVPDHAGDRGVAAEGAVWSLVILEVEPGGQCVAAFAAGFADAAAGTAVEHGADEAFGNADGLWPAWPRAQALDAERAAGDGMRERDVEGAVVGHHSLDLDAVGSSRVVVDRDLAELPAGLAATRAGAVREGAGVVLATSEVLAGAALDPA